jgi:hypothetical protein
MRRVRKVAICTIARNSSHEPKWYGQIVTATGLLADTQKEHWQSCVV